MKKQVILTYLAALACLSLNAQNLQTKSVSIFKNGQSFFIKSGTLQVQDGKWLLPDPAPAALYGTLWFSSPEGTLTKVESYPDTLREQKTETATAIHDLLRANTGKTATVTLEGGSSFTGVVERVEAAAGGMPAARQIAVFNESSMVTLRITEIPNGGWVTIPANEIRFVIFKEKPSATVSRETVTPRNLIELGFSTKKASQPVDLMYLANGLNWAPQYLLELTAENSATLTLQGEVANNLEDLTSTEVNLVVGVPNFQYADRPAFLIDFLQMIVPRSSVQMLSNALATQRPAYGDVFDEMPAPPPVSGVDGSTNEDLFFYTLKNFTLPKGGRTMQSIFSEKIEISHVYECNLPGNSDQNRFYDESFLFTPGESNKVFHTVKAANNTKQPWTTASVLVMNKQDGNRPVSQDLLTYTPNGGNTYIKLTESPDVKVKQAERELSRQQGAYTDKRRNIYYDLVQVEGKIKVNNYKDKKLNLRLQRTITGNLQKSSVDWQKEEIVNPNNRLNKRTNVCWETAIGAKGELEITYTYEIYVPGY